MQLWSSAHLKTLLPALIVMVIVTVLLRLILKDKPLRVRMIPLQIIAVVLLLLEIGKQTVSFIKGYDLYHIPLHFCSIMLVALPIMAFYRGKHAQLISGVACGLTAAVFLLTVIYPCLIYSAWDIENYFESYFAFHTVTFHNLVLFAFMLMPALQLHTPGKHEVRCSAIFIGIYCIVAAIASHVLKTNYNNLYQCNIAPLENVRLTVQGIIGYAPTQILYVLVVTCLDIAFVIGAYYFYRLCRKLLGKKQMPN
ncbi:MAG: YwaF family protein [Clostridia bacterium]|nr:YwaF family protein [Clostridia bacterium]